MASLCQFAQKGRKIIGVAANYRNLVIALNKPIPEEPSIFLKPSTAFNTNQKIYLPKDFSVNQEVELGVIIGKEGKGIKQNNVDEYIGGYCIALDLTAACRMKIARSKGEPWSIGKGFDSACPVSAFIPKEQIPNPQNIEIWSNVNGENVQRANTDDMIFTVPMIIEYVSKYMTLQENDLIITGTPKGMCQVKSGDIIEGGITTLPKYDVKFEIA